MGDCESVSPNLEGEEDLISAAQVIERALLTKRNLTSNVRKVLVNLRTQLCSMSEITESKTDEEEGLSEIEGRLNVVQNQVMNWEVDEYMIWDCGSEEASEYIKAVDEAQKLTETLESLCLNGGGKENKLLRKAHDVVNMAMARLEKEFRHLLVKNRQFFNLETSFRSSEEDVETEGSFISSGHGSVDDPFKHLLVQYRQPSEPEHVSFLPREIYVGNEGSNILVKNRQSFTPDVSFRSSEEDVETVGSFISSGQGSVDDPFKHLLVQNRQPSEPEHVSFRPTEIYFGNEGSMIALHDESVEDLIQRDIISKRSSQDFVIDFVHPSVIPDLKCIAKMMLKSNCGRECTQAFVSVQEDALDHCLYILAVDKLGIEDVIKMEWFILARKIKRWIKAMTIFVQVCLASEKRLSDQIFGDFAPFSSDCFIEASKSSMLQLLNFGIAITIGPHQPEKLMHILDMYKVLSYLIPDIDALYTDEINSYVRNEYQDVLRRLRYCVKATFLEVENLVASNISTNPFPGGGIHHLTRYVMNYLRTLTDYSETLNLLLNDSGKENSVTFSPDLNPTVEDNSSIRSSFCVSPTALHFRSLISILQCNLDEKSKLYKEDSLRHLFLMNNIHYMTQKVKDSELRTILGDEWIHKHNWKFQQQAMNYERTTWSSILSLLRDEGIHYPGSTSVSRTLLKERMQSFYVAFEEVYKIQTAWLIPDIHLREDLRISTSVKVIQAYRTFVGRHLRISASNKVIQAYRTFVGRHLNNLSDKSIKYRADDLENFLLHLFEGSPRSLNSFHRK